ncbi:MAG: response regulator transcription factor, partial [Treponemataceae bacterium]|nr:response regulator transcription factor [Treponemataceae bacterium]
IVITSYPESFNRSFIILNGRNYHDCQNCILISNLMNIIHSIRKQNTILPVMIVSSIQDDKTKIEGFREGCDDYITKPFYIEELLLRIKRMLSKLSLMSFEKKPVAKSYTAGIFTIDMDSMLLTKNGNAIPMRKKQFDLMRYFIQHPNVVLPFKTIYENVWNEGAPDEKTLESNMYVNIRSLRLLIEEDKNNPAHIISVSKSGYIFIPE